MKQEKRNDQETKKRNNYPDIECDLAIFLARAQKFTDPTHLEIIPVSTKYRTARADDWHLQVMGDTYGITDAPYPVQMYGMAGREHMEKYGKYLTLP